MSEPSSLPAYEPMLAAFHRCFSPELMALIDALPIERGQTLLDMPCGDGAYLPWLAERVGTDGRVVALDILPEYLNLARKEAEESGRGGVIEFAQSSVDSIPFDDGSFDFCWCAQSFSSLPSPIEALRQMVRLARPGGYVAVLESDAGREVLLSWPIEIELSVRTAELQAFVDRSEAHGKFYMGRQLYKLFREAGLEQIQQKSFVADRLAPFSPDERAFFMEYLEGLSQRAAKYIDPVVRAEFQRLADPNSGEFLLDNPDTAASYLGQLIWARKPSVINA